MIDLLTTNTRAHHHPDRSQRGTGSGQRGSGKYEVEVIITSRIQLASATDGLIPKNT